MKKTELKELIIEVLSEEGSMLTESDTQVYKKISFIRDSISNIRKTIREIDWKKATENEKNSVLDLIKGLEKILV